MSHDAGTVGPASARVYRDPEVELQYQILLRLDRIIDLLSGPKVELVPGNPDFGVTTTESVMWRTDGPR